LLSRDNYCGSEGSELFSIDNYFSSEGSESTSAGKYMQNRDIFYYYVKKVKKNLVG
jgi:hypothetical protein